MEHGDAAAEVVRKAIFGDLPHRDRRKDGTTRRRVGVKAKRSTVWAGHDGGPRGVDWREATEAAKDGTIAESWWEKTERQHTERKRTAAAKNQARSISRRKL